MREFADFKAVQALAPALRAGSATGGSIDRWGFGSLTFLVDAGARTDGTHTVAADHSDDDSTWEAIPADQLTGTLPAIAAAGDQNKATAVNYIGDRRYVRAKSTVTGSPATGAIVGITVLLGRPHSAPVA